MLQVQRQLGNAALGLRYVHSAAVPAWPPVLPRRDPSPEEIAALDLEGMRQAVMRQIYAGNVEVGAAEMG